MSPLEISCAVLVALLWGMPYAIVKVGLTVFPPLFFLGLRFAVVALILLPLVGRPTGRELRVIFLLSIFLGGPIAASPSLGLPGPRRA